MVKRRQAYINEYSYYPVVKTILVSTRAPLPRLCFFILYIYTHTHTHTHTHIYIYHILGALKLQDWTLQDWTQTDRVARVDIAGLDNDGPACENCSAFDRRSFLRSRWERRSRQSDAPVEHGCGRPVNLKRSGQELESKRVLSRIPIGRSKAWQTTHFKDANPGAMVQGKGTRQQLTVISVRKNVYNGPRMA